MKFRRALSFLLLTAQLAACNAPATAVITPSSTQDTSAANTTQTPTPTAAPTLTPTPAETGLTAQLDPNLDTTALPLTSAIRVLFNQPMDATSAASALTVYPYTAGTTVWDADYTAVSFQPDAPLEAEETYYAYLDPDLTSQESEKFSQNQFWTLITATQPSIISRTPSSAKISSQQFEISILFDRPMDSTSLSNPIKVSPSIPFHLEWKESRLTIIPDQLLAAGVLYNFILDGDLKDTNGVPMGKDYQWSYQISDLSVAINSTTDSVSLNFNYPIQANLEDLPFVIQPALSGTWKTVGQRNTHFTFSPDQPLKHNQQYTLHFTRQLSNSQGDPFPDLADQEFTLPLPISSYGPDDEEENENNWHGWSDSYFIWIKFSIDVDKASVEAAFHVQPEASGKFSWTSGSLIYTLNNEPISNTTYTFTLDTTALDSDQQPLLAEPVTWSYQTDNMDYGYDDDYSPYFGTGPKVQVIDPDGDRMTQIFMGKPEIHRIYLDLYSIDLSTFNKMYIGDNPDRAPASQPTYSWEITTSASETLDLSIPKEVDPGIYWLQMENTDGSMDYLFIFLTHNRLVVKQSDKDLFAWVTDDESQPVQGLEIRLYSDSGVNFQYGRSDEQGLYQTQLTNAYTPSYAVARGQNGEVTITLLNYTQMNSCHWSYTVKHKSSGDEDQLYLYTDRPIYQPGQTVNFKVIARNDDDVNYSLPKTGQPIQVTLLDGRENQVETLDLTLNDFGTASGAFEITEGAMLGNYTIQTSLSGYPSETVFKVQDYTKPDYQVEVSTDQELYTVGDKITLNVDTRYYYGEAVPDANLTIKLYQLNPIYSWWWVKDDLSKQKFTWTDNYTEITTNASTDENGLYTRSFSAELPESYSQIESRNNSQKKAAWGVEVTATDKSGQSVTGSMVYWVRDSKMVLASSVDNHYQEPDEPFELQVLATDYLGTPISKQEITVTLETYSRKHWDYEQVGESLQATTGENGQVTFSLNPPGNGYFRITVSTLDETGNTVKNINWVYVYKYDRPWYDNNRDELTIRADKDAYEPGDTAQLAIESDFSGPALITFERGHVIHSQPVELTAPLTWVDVTITDDDAPNVFITINAWKNQSASIEEYLSQFDEENRYYYDLQTLSDADLLSAKYEIQVAISGKTLQITAITDQESYAPGSEAEMEVTITDANGQPVEAEFSLSLVDEAIFSLSGELAAPITSAFYGRRQLNVTTFDTYQPFRWAPLGECGGGGSSTIIPRSNFEDTAVWLPSLRTDSNGKATVQFTLPDNLTSWRATIRAVTTDTLVGETTYNLVTRKDIVIDPVLPRSVTVQDEFTLAALVHNYTDENKEFDINLDASGLQISGNASQTLTLQAGKSRLVQWSVTAVQDGDAVLTFTADAGNALGDAVQLSLPVQKMEIQDISSESGIITTDILYPAYLPDNALTDSSKVTIQLSRSAEGSILSGLDYLTGYPYGCVEQTMSKALPNAMVGRIFSLLGVEDTSISQEMPEMIKEGLQTLYGYQHDDGGWGWWYDDDTDDYQTAWVIFGLSMTRDTGVIVDSGVIERGSKWLLKNLDQMDVRTQAFALYSLALAGYGDASATFNLAAAHTSELDGFSQAALALTFSNLGQEAQAKAMLNQLEAVADQKDGIVYWVNDTTDGTYYRKSMASNLRTTALALDAYIQIDPENALIPGIVDYLLSNRDNSGWGTTNETSFALLALTDYLLYERSNNDIHLFSITVNGQTVATGQIDQDQPTFQMTLTADQLQSGVNLVSITQNGSSRFYYWIQNQITFGENQPESAGKIKVIREYLDPETNKPITTVNPGDIVKVQLTLNFPIDNNYFLIEDSVPGGLEALNERLNNTTHTSYDDDLYGYRNYYWSDYGYNRKEIRDDKVSFFITSASTGTITLDYLTRATVSGTFSALPAEVSAMYDSTYWGRSASSTLTVLPAE